MKTILIVGIIFSFYPVAREEISFTIPAGIDNNQAIEIPEKGDAGKTKPAKMNTGLVVKVPLFIAEGETILVNTDTGDYLERA